MNGPKLSPVIVTGMHRSGTSMISRMLEDLGLFMGAEKDENHESSFFFHLGEWLLQQSGAAWDNPEPVKLMLDNPNARMLAVRYVQKQLASFYIIRYLGWRKFIRWRTPFRLPGPWGWKDPRVTFLMPLWLDVFPQAKIILIERHGVDVALSLQIRCQEWMRQSQRLPTKLLNRQPFLWWKMKPGIGVRLSLRCASPAEGFALWETHMKEGQIHKTNYKDQIRVVRYEDFLDNPKVHLLNLGHFCGLTMDDRSLERIAVRAKTHHAFAYRNEPSLRAFAEGHASRLAAWGYSACDE